MLFTGSLPAKAEPKSFADINNRQKFLKIPVAIFLLNLMPTDIRKKFVRCFLRLSLNDIADEKNRDLDQVKTWFQKNSTIRQIVNEDPTSSKTFEYLYQKKSPDSLVDYYFVWSQAAYRIYHRLQAIIAYNVKLYPKMLETRDELKILSLGSGINYGCLEAIAKLPAGLQKRIKVTNIDIDPWVIERGRQVAAELGLSKTVKYVQGDLSKLAEQFEALGLTPPYDKIEIVGTQCTKTYEKKIKTLGRISMFLLADDGVLMTSIPISPMIIGDPLTDFIMRITGWGMVYESRESIQKMASEAGLYFDKPYLGLPGHFTDGADNHLMPILRKKTI